MGRDYRKVCAPFLFFPTMKKILLLFLCILSFNATYADVTWNLSDDGTLTISGTGKMPSYSNGSAPWYSQRGAIKNVVIKNGVTSIGSGAFSGCDQITSITIPNSVTKIDGYAFNGCVNLTSIAIPNSVTSIGWYAFAYCQRIASIEIPRSVTSIGEGTFSNCLGLTSITIPNSVTSIGKQLFQSCKSLVSMKVEGGNIYYDSRNNCNAIIETQSNTLLAGCKNTIIPNSVKSIGNYAFYYCPELTSITIPNSVTSIGDGAFGNCSGLTSVTIPNSVTSIGWSAFYGCSGLTSVTIPNSVTSIGSSTFYGCSGLTSLTIPNSVTSIGNRAFWGCSALTSITIPNSVTIIGSYAFSNCRSLESIHLPESVTTIGEWAFNFCDVLTSITSEAKIPPYCYQLCFRMVKKSIPIYVPANSINAYKDADGWKDFTNIQPISVDPDLTLALTDASPNLTEGYYKNDKVTYTRNNMSVGDYATFCLPFDIDLSQTTDNFSKVYVPLNISLCKTSGSLLLLLDEVNSYSTIKACQPFVAKCKTSNVTFKNSSEVSFEGTISNPSATSVKVYNFDGVSAALTQKTDVNVKIGGTFSKFTGLDDDYYRAFFSNGSFGPTTSVNPFRMYVYKNDNNSLGSKITSISFDFNDETTGIKELRTTNSELPVYDLNGRAVNGKNLKSGIYIINGKKYIK